MSRPGTLGRPRGRLSARETILDDDRVARAAKKVRGSVKEAIGKITGNAKAEAEGALEKATGKARAAARNAKSDSQDVPEK